MSMVSLQVHKKLNGAVFYNVAAFGGNMLPGEGKLCLPELLADLSAFLPFGAKINVATSVCTGGCNSPPDYCICGIQIWQRSVKKNQHHLVLVLFGAASQI